MVLLYWMLVLANAAGFGTLAVGWWAVIVVALVGSAIAPRGSRPVLSVPLGCAIGWAALLVRSSRAESFPDLEALLARLLPVPVPSLGAATIALGLLLGLGSALLGAAVRRPRPEA